MDITEQSVALITGGASATYGADAVGGVVNFILKKNFQGFQLDGQYGISQRGDAKEYQIGGLLGTNFAGWDQDDGIVAAVESLPIPPVDRAAILGDNARRLFRIAA